MCGIAGIAGNPEIKLLSNITDRMIHRGPDDSGLWVNNKKNIGFGHRRLSIIDLESGHQPMLSGDGRYCIVFNGEIYNYLELRKKLQDKYHFRTHSDTETLLYHFIEYGIEGLNELNGMFAFAVWDNKTGRLVVVRDRLGIKPLYYAFIGKSLVFASEIQALIPELATVRIRQEAYLEYFCKKYISAPNTIYEDIHVLPAGHFLIYDNGTTSSCRRYWEIPHPEDDQMLKLSEDDYCRMVEEELVKAVKIRLRSDVPVGCFLSGGVDSSLITAIAARESSAPFHTFSVGYKDKKYDESKYAKEAAGKYGTIHHHLTLEEDDISIISRLHGMYGQPFGDASAIPTWHVSKLASQYVKVALSGDGADEIFNGYTINLAEYVADKYYRRYVPDFMRLVFHPKRLDLEHTRRWPYGARWFAKMLQYGSMDTREAYIHLQTSLIPDAGDRFAAQRCFASPDGQDKCRYLSIQERFINAFLIKVDIASMNNSLEVRSPFLDINLWELAFKIPVEKHLMRFTRKYILKKIASKYLPADLIYRKKMGFEVPLSGFAANQKLKLYNDKARIKKPWSDSDGHVFAWLTYNNWQKDLHI